MHSGKISGAALATGALLGLATMAIHPTGARIDADAAQLAASADATRLAHGLALAAAPLMLFGYADFTRRLGVGRASALAGISFWGFATIALLGAALMSGPVAGQLLEDFARADAAERARLHTVMDTAHYLNGGFALVYGLASAAAIAAWSTGLWAAGKMRGLAGLGLLVGLGQTVLFTVGGRDAISIHGFLAVALAQGVWAVGLGIALWRDWTAAE